MKALLQTLSNNGDQMIVLRGDTHIIPIGATDTEENTPQKALDNFNAKVAAKPDGNWRQIPLDAIKGEAVVKDFGTVDIPEDTTVIEMPNQVEMMVAALAGEAPEDFIKKHTKTFNAYTGEE